MGHELVGQVQKEAEAEFRGIAADYGQESRSIKARNGDKVVSLSFHSSDGSNYSTVGVSMF